MPTKFNLLGKFLFVFVCFFCLVAQIFAQTNSEITLPKLEQVLSAKKDLWGEAAMHEPNGASYEFFEKLLPPPRYVNADFHFYPIVLSASNAKVKARLISNGSGVNLRGGTRSWNDVGTAVTFRVGPDEFRFGEILNRVQHPKLAQGFLPIVQIDYEHPTQRHDNGKAAFQNSENDPAPEIYRLEAFASTDPQLAENGVVFVSFSLAADSNGFVMADIDSKSALKFVRGNAVDEKGETLVWFDEPWNLERKAMHARISGTKSAVLAIATKPLATNVDLHFSSKSYGEQRQKCIDIWQNILSAGMNVETPEPIVNNAWKNLIIQDFSITKGDRLNYSDGNQYEKMYAAETSDAAVPLMSWGYEKEMRRFLPVILDLKDKQLTNHFASHKLDTLCKFFWQTRDAEFVKAMRPRWQKELDWILNNRGEHGLLPKDNYCTDIEQPVFSLSSNAKCWAALRDMIPVLEEIGDNETAQRVKEIAPKYKAEILDATEKSIRRETDPPFIPAALFGAEDLHDPITETRIGSYWDLVANYLIGSRIFVGSEKETWIPKYFETHGGLCMGLTRSAATNHTFWTGKHRTNPLYGMRYVEDALRRDDVERALVNFYGMLSHGMTRNTFIGAEGTAIEPLDEGGRFFYCPPNTASNGEWLWVLRNLLVQDFDLDNDGRPETLRLGFGTPKRWLENGKIIKVENAPTAFGFVSMKLESKIEQGEVLAELDLPKRNKPEKILLRARVPAGWRVVSAQAGNENLKIAQGTADISDLRGKVSVRFQIRNNKSASE
jgi:hypothetical protein